MKNTLHAVKAVVILLCLGLLLGRAALQGQKRATAETTTAATQFLSSLTPEQRATAVITFGDANRFDWHYVPRPGQRKGLPLKEMTPPQRQAAQKLLATALSAKGMKQSGQIMNDLELVLRGDGPKPAMGRDPELYYFTVFGTPGDKAAWGWRVEGHHLSQNFTIANGTLRPGRRLLWRESGRSDEGRVRDFASSRRRKTRRSRCCARWTRSRNSRRAAGQSARRHHTTTNARRVNPLAPDGLPRRA